MIKIEAPEILKRIKEATGRSDLCKLRRDSSLGGFDKRFDNKRKEPVIQQEVDERRREALSFFVIDAKLEIC